MVCEWVDPAVLAASGVVLGTCVAGFVVLGLRAKLASR
jgi:hypothetical protein